MIDSDLCFGYDETAVLCIYIQILLCLLLP
jgi:hypothetical protein